MGRFRTTSETFEIIENLLKEKKISENEFYKLVDISDTTLSLWKTKNILPDIEIVNKIGEFLNVSSEWLLYESDKPEDIILNKIFNIYIVSPNINRNNYKNYSLMDIITELNNSIKIERENATEFLEKNKLNNDLNENLARRIQHCRMRLKDLKEAEKLIKQLEEIKHYNY